MVVISVTDLNEYETFIYIHFNLVLYLYFLVVL